MPAISGPVVATSPTGQQLAIGPPGPAGPTGPAGPPGPSGAGSDGQFNVTLANGLNSNIPLSSQVTQRVGGPSAAFSIGGFAPSPSPVGGQRLSVVNTTSQPMTFVHEDSSSSPSNRIDTQMGVPYTLPAKRSSASFVYDAISQRWVLQAAMPRPVLDVDVREFGAVCDGVSFPSIDDGPAIQAALNYVSSQGGGTVQIPQLAPSTYTLIKTTIALPPNCRVTGGHGAGSVRSTLKHAPQASGSAIDPSTGVALSGTVSVTNGSANITFSVAQTLPAGTVLTFGSQYAVPYTLLNPISGSTSGTLTAAYNGTTNASTSAQQCLGYVLFKCSNNGSIMSAAGASSLTISTPNAQANTTFLVQDAVYCDFENMLIGGQNLDERNVAFHFLSANNVVPTPGFHRLHNIATTSFEAAQGWSGNQSIGVLIDVAAGVTQGPFSGGSLVEFSGYGDIEGRGTSIQATKCYGIRMKGWALAATGNGGSAGAANNYGTAINLIGCQFCHFVGCYVASARPVAIGGSPSGSPTHMVLIDSNCFENVIDAWIPIVEGQTLQAAISDLGTNTQWRGTGGSSGLAPHTLQPVNPAGAGLPTPYFFPGGAVYDVHNKALLISDGTNWRGQNSNSPLHTTIDGAAGMTIAGGGGVALNADGSGPQFFGPLRGNNGTRITFDVDPSVLQCVFIPGAAGFGTILYGCGVATSDYAPNGVALRGESSIAGASVGHRNGADALLQGGRPDSTNGGASGNAKLQVLQKTTGNPLDVVVAASPDGATIQLGLFGVTPTSQPTRAGQLTDLTGGSFSSTLAAITAGASYAQADMVAVKNAIASLAAKVNALDSNAHALGAST